MCGIAGFVGEGNREILEGMTRVLHHRGPDAEGYYFSPASKVGLGHRRLKIIDLEGGAQPMLNSKKSNVIVFNGEIYNFQDLREDLQRRNYRFSSKSDTEVILQGYEEFGLSILDKLDGMFSFAIYDKNQELVILARDRMGKKPLYYFADRKNGVLIFGSELKSLVKHPRIPFKLDSHAVLKYFSYGYVPAPMSIVEGVNKLPAAHYLLFDISKKTVQVNEYWKIRYRPKLASNFSHLECSTKIQTLLEKSVKKRLVSDVPLGVFLSGGIDSTAIACFAAKNCHEKKIKSFSISFDNPSFDESKYSLMAAKFLGTDHYDRRFTAADLLDTLPDALNTLDEPMADASLLPTFHLAKFAREQVTVALSGDGGDELFAGYDPFLAQVFAKFLETTLPQPTFDLLGRLLSFLPASEDNMSLEFKLKRFFLGMKHPGPIRHNVWMSPLDPDSLNAVFHLNEPSERLFHEAGEYFSNGTGSGDLDRFIHVWTRTYLQDDILTKLDRASMGVSLEGRCPFLDKDFVEFVSKIPGHLKFRKYILKKAMTGLIPAEIISRPKKGFGLPLAEWLKSGLREHLEMATSPDQTSSLGMDNLMVQNLKNDHLSGKIDHRLFLWALITLVFWKKNLSNSITAK